MKSQSYAQRHPIAFTLTAIMACVLPAAADVTLAKVFTDNMMFQRKQPIRVWGTAEAGEEVSVVLGKKSAKATTSAEGKWMAELPAVEVGDNLELAIKGKNTLSLKNIIIGDIWVCSGQSNMEMGLGGCLGSEEDIKAADFPKIRRIKFNHMQTPQPQAEAPTATAWQVCSPATAGGFTAAGFYFAREVMQKTGVPIGIIDSNWGGTRIEPWIAAEGLPLVEALKAANPGGFSGMYNGMIYPIIKMPIKGALWYQGESNGEEGQTYNDKMQALIAGWRKQWGVGDFPFYFVQLANFQNPNQDPAGGNGWAKLREAQTKTLSVPNTGMAVIIDTVTLPEAGDIHPKNKYDVGSRLAQWALAKDYGKKEVVFSGP
ncbi:MAG: sialate O-acetylesterase, partial [Verrucomicrobia bacterium]|nr:sialate O-acetylesterase [Verrucomicrobiota bacterium]